MTNSSSSFVTPVLHMTGVTKAFAGVPALRGASIDVRPGEVHGLVGENGAGKSTLIKILAGIYARDAGSVVIGGTDAGTLTPADAHAAGIRFVHQELQLVPDMTVAENVWLGNEQSAGGMLRGRRMKARVTEVLHDVLGIRLSPTRLVRDLGPAERKLVQVARALVDDDARLIVFDEPTAPLASAEAEQLLGIIARLRDRGISSLYISHYLGEVTRICDRVTVLRGGLDVGRIETVDAESGREMIRLMIGREIDDLYPARRAAPIAEPVLRARGLRVGSVVQGVDLDVRPGEILGVTGLLGSGASELAESLVGLHRHTGELSLSGRRFRPSSPAAALDAGVVLVPRDRRHDGVVLDFSTQRNLTLSTLGEGSRGGLLDDAASRERASQLAERLDIRPRDTAVQTRLLSGGNQQKVVLGRSLAAGARVIVLDEPTVGVDIGAKQEIYRLLAELAASGTAVVVVSTDPAEVLGLSDRIVVLERGRVAHEVSTDGLTLEHLSALVTGSTADPRTEGDAA
ncbi:ribose transport system ATP-binding protein [Microbacterium sp. SORGH_AS 1204]|uniref:sugar ABC transporter ATP-binding protein n=1 Tax=Microbacterium sp. SORGH_AS_1204 TaxID=3041785 RepID=UPI00278D8DB3|nr:sugar ABC transporter ATP-binding protein [Microbacterium sp. SORGH_AS_1204]MDQ1135560.1 ribose transport system ATP-binding protein [Microbacterium sp. SORGH_AS_1204]